MNVVSCIFIKGVKGGLHSMKLNGGKQGYVMHTKYPHLSLVLALQPWWVGRVQTNIDLMCIAIYSRIASNIMTSVGLFNR
jgi:hypothetical protein